MTSFNILIENIQHIEKLNYSINLSNYGINAIVGKNGVGKTMLFKAIQNLITGTTFATTSNQYIFNDKSLIQYDTDYEQYIFKYNTQLKTLDYKGAIDSNILNKVYVELSIPFGERFKQFQKLGQIDKDLKRAIATKSYTTPSELIELLNYIYNTERFNNLKEIKVKKEYYYFIELENSYYVREDYLSSGEYFIINIFKLIKKGSQLIAIDELDISLDSMAQVRLTEKLREFAKSYELQILFSTHSLALLKTLADEEITYMSLDKGHVTFENKSYNYIKSLLFGFQGFDKYILVEDDVLKDYIEYIIRDENIQKKYIIIPIAGATNTVTLMDNNKEKLFFNIDIENVITILDGDYSSKGAYQNRDDILFLPFASVEKDFFKCFTNGEFSTYYTSKEELFSICNIQSESNKTIYNGFIRGNIMSQQDIFEYLNHKSRRDVETFRDSIKTFLL